MVNRGRQCFRKVSGEWLGESIGSSIFECQPVIGPVVRGHEACHASHHPQSGGESIRHGEGNPVAADLVLRRNGYFDFGIALAELTRQIIAKLLESMVASRLVDRSFDVEDREAFG